MVSPSESSALLVCEKDTPLPSPCGVLAYVAMQLCSAAACRAAATAKKAAQTPSVTSTATVVSRR
jgi:hypothetical protein